MQITYLFIIICVNILTLTIAFLLFYKRSKKLIYKYFDKSSKDNKEFIQYIGNIENRFKKEVKTNSNLEYQQSNKENWALIVSFNRGELVQNLIIDIKKYDNEMKIIVIDNGSKQETIKILSDLKIKGGIDLLVLNTN